MHLKCRNFLLIPLLNLIHVQIIPKFLFKGFGWRGLNGELGWLEKGELGVGCAGFVVEEGMGLYVLEDDGREVLELALDEVFALLVACVVLVL